MEQLFKKSNYKLTKGQDKMLIEALEDGMSTSTYFFFIIIAIAQFARGSYISGTISIILLIIMAVYDGISKDKYKAIAPTNKSLNINHRGIQLVKSNGSKVNIELQSIASIDSEKILKNQRKVANILAYLKESERPVVLTSLLYDTDAEIDDTIDEFQNICWDIMGIKPTSSQSSLS